MLKRILFISLALVLSIACLYGCNIVKQSETKDKSEEQEEPVVEEPKVIEDSEWTANDTMTMSNYMNRNWLYLSGSWVYGIDFNSDSNGYFYKQKVDGTEKTQMTNYHASFITSDGGWLYYIGYSYTDDKTQICKVKLSGDENKVIVKPKEGYEFLYMFLYDGRIYYCMEKERKNGELICKLQSCDLKGKNNKTVLEKATYFPYIINDKIVYQDDVDYCKLHCCNLDGSDDITISEDVVFAYVYDGKYIYYQTTHKKPKFDKNHHPKGEYKYKLKRMNVDGSNVKTIVKRIDSFVISKKRIFYTDSSDDDRLYSCNKKGKDIQLLSQETHLDYLTIYGKKLLFVNYDSAEKYIDNVQMCDLDGTNIRELFS